MSTFPTFDGGRSRKWKGPWWTTQPAVTPIPESALDPQSLFADAAWFFKTALEEKLSSGVSFQTLLSESNEELAALLRDVHTPSDAELGSTLQSQPNNKLLMRAVHCALKQHVLQARLSSLALTDELTGLYNRRGFLCLSEVQLKLARRSGCDMVLFFLDVDGLKQINDSFGHSEGDAALIRTAEALRMTFRKSDVLARLGGDEFGALAIEASGFSKAAILARLRESLKKVSAQQPSYSLALSVGVAQFTFEKGSLAELMLLADQAMYQAKRNQRRSMIQTESKDSLEHIPVQARTRTDAIQRA
jgi:diguanylate cyclase (GGDEF)-like protein